MFYLNQSNPSCAVSVSVFKKVVRCAVVGGLLAGVSVSVDASYQYVRSLSPMANAIRKGEWLSEQRKQAARRLLLQGRESGELTVSRSWSLDSSVSPTPSLSGYASEGEESTDSDWSQASVAADWLYNVYRQAVEEEVSSEDEDTDALLNDFWNATASPRDRSDSVSSSLSVLSRAEEKDAAEALSFDGETASSMLIVDEHLRLIGHRMERLRHGVGHGGVNAGDESIDRTVWLKGFVAQEKHRQQ